MLIALHKNARTTPAVRAEIAASNETASVLAQRYGITEQTVYKWKKRDVFGDRSHTAHRLQTVLTPAQETVVVHLRRTLLLPLDDLLAVTREFLSPHVSRSGLDRCLRRHGAGNLNDLKPREPVVVHKDFKSYEPGYVHVDVKYLPQMQEESSRRYLFVAIDRATRWVFVQFKANKTAASAQAFLKALHKACPIRISKLLTDNGKEFTDRLFASKEREPSGNHEFDQLCQELGIEHRLTKPRTPRTNGMVERFNGRIADVLKTHRFNSREDMQQTLERYVALYNHQLPQSALGSKTPMQAMKQWYQEQPELFHKRPYDRPGCDTYALLEPLFNARKPILLYVHGNNNTPAACFKRVQTLQKSYPEAEVIGFSWPSEGFLSNGEPLPELSAAALVAASTDDENNLATVTNENRTKDTIKGRLFRFRQAQNNAKHSNESLARLLRLIAAVRLRTNGKPYSLAIHSLGTQLFQYALQADGATEAASAAHNVALLAPCVHTTGHKEWISRFRPKGRTYIMYNKGDTVLLGAFIADGGQAKLGVDPGNDRVKSSGVRYVSFSDARNNPGGHGYFVAPKNKALELFTRIFTSRIDFDVHESPKVVYPIGCDHDGTTCYMAVPKDSIPEA